MITGLFLVAAFWVFCFNLWRESKNLGLSQEKVIDLALLTAVFGLAGARAVFVFEHWSLFQPSLVRALLLLKYPGISITGLSLTVFVVVLISSKMLKLKPMAALDFFAMPVVLFVFVSLLGCVNSSVCVSVKTNILPQVLGGLTAFIVFLYWIKFALSQNPIFSKIATRHGFVFLISIIGLFVMGLVLVRGVPIRVYSYLQGLTFLSVLVFAIRYHFIFNMIKLPQSVLGQIKEYLEKRKQDTERSLAELKREDPNSDKGRTHEEKSDDDFATEKANHERVAAVQLQLNRTLVEIRKALTKIKVGTYGNCENCHKMIDTDRLAAMPSATLCLDCEKKKEKGRK